MYKYLFLPWIDHFFAFNVFRYITFRMGLAALTAMVVTILVGPYVIRKLYSLKMGQEIRNKDECPPLHALHKNKQGTPTMGGLLFVFSVLAGTFLWGDLSHPYIWISSAGIFLFGAIGFVDDYLKIKKKRSQGLSPRQKFVAQAILALLLGFYLLKFSDISTFAKNIYLPFIKGLVISNSEWFYLIFVVLVITGTSNAVNLTDGLDGLAIGCTIICSTAFAVIAYVVGNKIFCNYLFLEYIRESAELSVFCSAMVGAGLGFLWFNAYPAQVFMGDTGALSIGGALGLVAVLIKKELYLILIGGVFVMEALSVILQVTSFRFRKKRIFLCSPLHHHFEMKGWPETKVTARFWILAIIFALLGISSLKLR
ncbi:MAG: phospho-N-acetylmuramoyl-pentapeptide-transferase [Candidatus Aureabacteria bacterium]|nr:phospho-N-acetylmuramoyl-pentapeptide-transferase [Candidatus Auribacterota bacterium]